MFKKGSPNGKITVYLGKRDFVDHVTHVDPIDGVVLVDPEYLKVGTRYTGLYTPKTSEGPMLTHILYYRWGQKKQ